MTLPDWQPSVHYTEGVVDASLERAWELMIDYQGYNPTFVGATVTHVSGEPGGEDEVVLIEKIDRKTGAAAAPFYCVTAKLEPRSHIVWYVHLRDEDTLRNFVDFGLREEDGVVTFSIAYYAQGRISGDDLRRDRELLGGSLDDLVGIFQRHCVENGAG